MFAFSGCHSSAHAERQFLCFYTRKASKMSTCSRWLWKEHPQQRLQSLLQALLQALWAYFCTSILLQLLLQLLLLGLLEPVSIGSICTLYLL